MTSADERPLVVLPSLAATLGLEEAVLYQLLCDWCLMHDCTRDQGMDWHLVDRDRLLALAPFWDRHKLSALLQTLADQGVITLGSALGENFRNYRLSLSRVSAPAAAPAPAAQPAQRTPLPTGNTVIAANWQPATSSVNYLQRFHGIEPEFIAHHVPEFIAYWQARGEVRSSWDSTFSQHVIKRWEQHAQKAREQAARQPLDRDWRPADDALAILVRSGIPQDFVEDCIPEFILKWREKGIRDNSWNKRFVEHTREQWAWHCNEMGGQTQPTRMTRDWQPDAAVYDILRMADIDIGFAQQLLPEFVLYWTDNPRLQRSWNSKFLQHVKYRWAQRHQLERAHGKTGFAAGQAGTGGEDIFQRLTDRSWADGITGSDH